MKILIIGSNSALYQTSHKKIFASLSDKINLNVTEVTRGFAFACTPQDDYKLIINYLNPTDPRVLKLVLDHLAALPFVTYHVSSSSVNSIDHRYSYVQSKIAAETLAISRSINVLRCGGAKIYQRSISPYFYTDDELKMAEFLNRVRKNDHQSVEKIYVQKKNTLNLSASVISRIYKLLNVISLQNTIFLRPIDLALRSCGIYGYGYSFIYTKDPSA